MKIMIVDDELYFREALKKSISWKDLDLEICAEAADGITALELARDCQPEIILADINMPKMNGLEFIKRLKEASDKTKVIIISGYDEFDYARQAISLGVNHYLLKPVAEEELFDILKKLIGEIEKQEVEELEKSRKMKGSLRNRKIAEQYFLNRLLSTDSKEKNDIYIEELKKINPALTEISPILVIILEIDQKRKMPYEEQELSDFIIINILEEILEKKASFQTCVDEEKRVILVMEDEFEEEQTELLLCGLQNATQKDFNFTLSVGIGESCEDIRLLHKGYVDALRALNSKKSAETGKILFSSKVDFGRTEFYYIQPQHKMQLLLLLREKKEKEIKDLISKVYQDIGEKRLSRDALRMVTIDFLTPCLQYIEEKQMCFDNNEIVDSFSIFAHINMKDSTRECYNYVLEICIWICRQNIDSEKEAFPATVASALQFIKEHYQDTGLSVDIIAKNVFSNYNYLCVLFKKTVGITVNDFILKYRMQKAMEIINSGVSQVAEAAEKVGYENVNYFTKCFKKEVGVPPSKYIAFIDDYRQFYS